MIKPETVDNIIIDPPCPLDVPPPPPPKTKWGTIDGNINAQKDLKNALDSKAYVSSVQANTDSIKTLSTNLNNTIDSVDILENTVNTLETTKQDTLVSGTNIKTINNTSLLGSGNITIEGGTSNHYSTSTEELIGTWIDGKNLYRKVFTQTLTTYGDFNYNFNTNWWVVMYKSFFNTGNFVVNDMYENSVKTFIDNGASHINVKTNSSAYNNGWARNVCVILYYTKKNES